LQRNSQRGEPLGSPTTRSAGLRASAVFWKTAPALLGAPVLSGAPGGSPSLPRARPLGSPGVFAVYIESTASAASAAARRPPELEPRLQSAAETLLQTTDGQAAAHRLHAWLSPTPRRERCRPRLGRLSPARCSPCLPHLPATFSALMTCSISALLRRPGGRVDAAVDAQPALGDLALEVHH